MIKNVMDKNKVEKIIDKEVEALKELIPSLFDRFGNFNISKLDEILKKAEIDLSKESYSLNWLGKSYARLLANLETETILTPDIIHNEKEENLNTKNLYLEGDNLDVLKHLVKSYSNKIKMIYIDPPYNTGEDFI